MEHFQNQSLVFFFFLGFFYIFKKNLLFFSISKKQVEKKIVSKKPDNEPAEAETACNNAEDIMFNLSNFKIFQIYNFFL